MEAIFIDIEGISNRVYYVILDIYYENQLELESVNGIIPERTKSRSLRYNNIYRRY